MSLTNGVIEMPNFRIHYEDSETGERGTVDVTCENPEEAASWFRKRHEKKIIRKTKRLSN